MPAQTRCDSLNTLQTHLEKTLKGIPKFVLVLDGIDRQKEAPFTLLAGLARFGFHVRDFDSDATALKH